MPHLIRNRNSEKRRIDTFNFVNGDKTILRTLFKEAVKYGDNLDIKEYSSVKIHEKYDKTSFTKSKQGTRRHDSFTRARTRIYRLIHANVNAHGKYKPVFATFTFEDDITRLSDGNRLFTNFIKRLSYALGYTPKYLTVPEIQTGRERRYGVAVWHYHTVFFNLRYMDKLQFERVWSHGFTNIQLARNVKDIGAYLSKYLSKSIFDKKLYGKKCYFCSRGLIKPEVIYQQDVIEYYENSGRLQLVNSFEGNGYTQSKYKIV